MSDEREKRDEREMRDVNMSLGRRAILARLALYASRVTRHEVQLC